MFAAKKKKSSSGGWKLGLVPTTLLIALVFGSGYGYYVWLQIQPPSQPRVAQRTAPPPAPYVVAPIATCRTCVGSVYPAAGKVGARAAGTAAGHGAQRRLRRTAQQTESEQALTADPLRQASPSSARWKLIPSRRRCSMPIRPISAATTSRRLKATAKSWARTRTTATPCSAWPRSRSNKDKTRLHNTTIVRLLVLDPRDPASPGRTDGLLAR